MLGGLTVGSADRVRFRRCLKQAIERDYGARAASGASSYHMSYHARMAGDVPRTSAPGSGPLVISCG
jgi:hypothetical protein